MKIRFVQLSFLFVSFFLFTACNEEGNDGKSAVIVMGDTATIVTEKNKQNLGDFVADVQVKEIEKRDSIQKSIAATEEVATETKTTAPIATGKGLQVNFNDIQVFIPGIETKSFTTQNPEKSGQATYQVSAGNIKGNQLHISGVALTKISQRTISYVLATNELGKLHLQSLGTTSDWKEITGRNGVYTITGLNPNQIEVKNATPAAIKNAVVREARKSRCSHKTIDQWQQVIGDNPALNRPPFTADVRSILWKIEGKDAKGRTFYKQLRLDLPDR